MRLRLVYFTPLPSMLQGNKHLHQTILDKLGEWPNTVFAAGAIQLANLLPAGATLLPDIGIKAGSFCIPRHDPNDFQELPHYKVQAVIAGKPFNPYGSSARVTADTHNSEEGLPPSWPGWRGCAP